MVLFDGTWQTMEDQTNVSLYDQNIEVGDPTGTGTTQIKKYFAGVGTSMFGKLIGGVFGYGLSETIKESYLWLSQTYKPGDEVFVFGYSRGSYSARSLVGLMHKVGGVVKNPTPKLVDEAYDLYRDAKSDPSKFITEHGQPARVRMIGVWETVGSLGVPVPGLPLVLPGTREYYRFHDMNLSCIVDEAYHALAIDENRADFEPALWDATTEKNKAVEQCWFIGAHGDIGGGSSGTGTLWKLPYVWMQEKAIAAGLRFSKRLESGDEWKQAPSDSFATFLYGLYRIYKLNQRFFRTMGEKVEETLHPSVLLRVQNGPEYRPKSLTNAGIPETTTVLERRHVVKPCGCENDKLKTS